MENALNGEDAIEGLVRKGERTGITVPELDTVTGPRGYHPLRALELPLVDIDSHEIQSGELLVETGHGAAEAATDIQYALPLAHLRSFAYLPGQCFSSLCIVLG